MFSQIGGCFGGGGDLDFGQGSSGSGGLVGFGGCCQFARGRERERERQRGVDWRLGRELIIGPEEMVVVWECGCFDLGRRGCDLFR